MGHQFRRLEILTDHVVLDPLTFMMIEVFSLNATIRFDFIGRGIKFSFRQIPAN